MKPKGFLKIAGVFALGFALTACKGQISEKPPIHPNMNMDQQPRKEAQEENNFFADGRSMRQPVEGTVARGLAKENTVFYQGVTESGDYVEEIPVDVTKSLLYRGKQQYEVFCAPCHGDAGYGQGIIMTGNYGFVPAPSYHDLRLRSMPEGQLYSAIANGVRTMASYATQVATEDRWAIVAYIRALQESQNATEEDLREYGADLASLQGNFEEEKARQDSIEAAKEPAAPVEATVEKGKEIANANACTTCHTIDGTEGGIGPTWAGLYGSEAQVVTQDGETISITKDEEYIRESIVNPEAKKSEGYENGFMASYSYLADSDVESLILYIKSLSDK